MASQSTIAQRFTVFLNDKNYSQKIFSDLSGISSATVSNIASGATELPKADFFQAMVRHFPEVNLRWLLVGVGEMYLPEGELESSSMIVREPEEPPAVYRPQGRSMEQLTGTVEKLTVMLSDCMEEKKRLMSDK